MMHVYMITKQPVRSTLEYLAVAAWLLLMKLIPHPIRSINLPVSICSISKTSFIVVST